MTKMRPALHGPHFTRLFSIASATFALTLLMTASAFAQYNTTTSLTDGGTPSGVAPGAPAGAYPLGGFDTINLFNGHLNFNLPLMAVGGRGEASYTISLPIEQTWRVKKITSYSQGPGGFPSTPPNYQYYPEYNSWNGIKPGYSPGVLQGRRARDRSPDPTYQFNPQTRFCETLTRLTFTAANGTEYELRDQLTDGAPHGSTNGETFTRGTVFVSRDGTSLTFISDSPIADVSCTDTSYATMNGLNFIYPSGYLLFPDGNRYRMDGGKVTWIRDRNGNQLSFTSTSVTDPLNRTVTFSGGITFNGFGGIQRTISVNYSSLSQVLRADVPGVKTYYQLFPLNSSSTTTPFDPTVVSSVVLPDGRGYSFKYNEFGELARVELPTGGAFEYDYGAGSASSIYPSGMISITGGYAIYRRVVRKRIYKENSAGASPESTVEFSIATDGTIEEAQYANSNTAVLPLARTKHYFYGSALSSFNSNAWYPNWNEGKEYQTDVINPATGSALRVVSKVWQNHNSTRPYDPYIEQITTKLADTNQIAKQSFIYDQYNNKTDIYEYDFGSGAPPLYPTRHVHTDYLATNVVNGVTYNYQTDTSIHLRNLPKGTRVYDVNASTGAETLFSETAISYDQSTLTDTPGITGQDTAFNSSYRLRGNVTRTARWLNTGNIWLNTDLDYDVAGNVVRTTDPRGFVAQIEYAGTSYAYPTRALSPVPGAPYGSTTALETIKAYDFWTGLVTSSTDANGQVTTFEYNDALSRPTKIVRPAAGGWTSFEYNTGPYGDYIHRQTLQNSAGAVADTYQFFDGLGRPYRSFENESVDPSNIYLTSDTQYDAMGRLWRVSNTYRSVNAAAPINPSGNWTTTQYDALGRPISVTTPDNAVVTTSYSGNHMTVTDQAGKRRSGTTDGLGRLRQAVEDPNGLAYLTDYTYDALGNLRKVSQGTQNRCFMYDSLSRLIRVKTPEQDINASLTLMDPVTGNTQWSTSYAYDAANNLISRMDSRGVSSGYVYDALNRNTEVNYSDGSNIRRYYDGATLGRGRPWLSYRNPTNGASSHTAIDSYDAMGRPLSQRQQFYEGGAWGASYTVSRTYDLAGHITTQTYPSGRGVGYTYDRVGRTATFNGNLGDGLSRAYMAAISFDDSGRMTREQFGTDTLLYNKRHYNVRGQLYDMRLSSVNDDSDWNRGAIVNYYSLSNYGFGTSGADNNGNLYVQQTWIPGGSYMQQNYGYDSLNRLSSVGEYQNGGTQTGVQNYTYDRWGNRTVATTSSGTGINAQQFTVDPDTNRLGVPSGQTGLMGYDAGGNLINDTYSSFGPRTYDAENRMVTAADNGGGVSQYTYDADGHRVRRQTGAQQTWQVYGIDGELVAEYGAGAAATAPQKEYGYRNGELLITGEAPSSTGINVAQNRRATQSSELVAGVAGRAVDGNTNGDWNYSSVTHTDYNNHAWWEVDLGSVQPLSNVKVWNRTDCCGSRLSNFYIFVSDVPFTSHDLTITLGQSGVASFYTAGAAGASVTQAVNRTGRYVRVQLSGADYLSLAEVQVFSANAAAGIHWLISDQLGTPRMVADQSGSLTGIKRHDYLPFGEELFAGTGGRTTAQGYVADAVRQKFTSYERDRETGLDYAQARYYSSNHGRFTSPDALLSSGNTMNPQSWNKYSYASNSPLSRVDPSGLFDWGVSLGGDATDAQILTNTCAQRQCTVEERRAGKRTAEEAQQIVNERQQILAAIKMLQNLLSDATFSGNLDSNEYEGLGFAVGALGNPGDHNGVTLESSSVNPQRSGFTTMHNGATSTIFMQANLRGISLAFGLAHEGQHVRDWNLFAQGRGKRLSQFEYEVRGFETEGIAAKARGVTRYPTAGNTEPGELLWNKSWAPVDVHYLRHSAAMYRVTRDYTDSSGKPLSQENQGPRWRR